MAARSPVGAIPEESRVASVRDDVIHIRRCHNESPPVAVHAEGVIAKKEPSAFTPFGGVVESSLLAVSARCVDALAVLESMLRAAPAVSEIAAARMKARRLRLER